jgi:hypothetical protein
MAMVRVCHSALCSGNFVRAPGFRKKRWPNVRE